MSRDNDLDRPGGGAGRDIPNYLVQSILVTVFCCLPLGIVAIINAAKVNSETAKGNYAAAQEASQQAKKWSTYGAIGGVVVFVLYMALNFLVLGGALIGGGAGGAR